MEVEIDLSPALGVARSQGQRLTCLAFSVSDLNRSVSGAPDYLSPEFLYQMAGSLIPGWVPGEGLYVPQALRAAHKPGQPLETDFPYLPNDPCAVAAPTPPAGKAMFSSKLVNTATATQAVIDSLHAGKVVGLVLSLTLEFLTPVAGVVPFSPMALPHSLHAVLATGWGSPGPSGERHVLIRNSWGPSWGVNGYAWLPESFVDLHAQEAFGA
jgi:hypothetical protein